MTSKIRLFPTLSCADTHISINWFTRYSSLLFCIYLQNERVVYFTVFPLSNIVLIFWYAVSQNKNFPPIFTMVEGVWNLLQNPYNIIAVQKFWKLVKIWRSYREFNGGQFFWDTCSCHHNGKYITFSWILFSCSHQCNSELHIVIQFVFLKFKYFSQNIVHLYFSNNYCIPPAINVR